MMKIAKTNISLMLQFSSLILSVFIIFIILIYFSYNIILEHKHLEYKHSNESIPYTIRVSNVYANARELSSLFDNMVNSLSYAKSKLVLQKALSNIEYIENSNVDLNKEHLAKIKDKFNETIKLIKEETNLRKKIHSKIAYFNSLSELFMDKLYLDNNSYRKILIALEKIKILLIQSSLLENKKPRFLLEFIKKNLDIITSLLQNDEDFISKLKLTLVSSNELHEQRLALKAKISNKRMITKSIIESFSDNTRYLSVKNNQYLIEEAQKGSYSLQSKTNTLFILFVATLIYLALIVYYFKQKVIKRLQGLNEFIANKNFNNEKKLVDNGADEISNIIHSYNFYAHKIEELSLTDSLTGIANKRFFDIRLKSTLDRIKRDDGKVSIILLDIDNFKQFNDNYGHIQGDKCLKEVAKALKKNIKRDVDLIARYGGEEFVCILTNTDIKGSKIVAKALLKSVRELKIPHDYSKCSRYVSISIGIKTFSKKEYQENRDIIEEADRALYIAKSRGKNTFVHFDENYDFSYS